MQHSGLYSLLHPEVCLGTSRCDVDLCTATKGCIYENVTRGFSTHGVNSHFKKRAVA